MNAASDESSDRAIGRRQLLAYSTATVSLAALFSLTRTQIATAADTWTHPFASHATHNANNPFGLYDPATYSTAPHKHRGSDFNKTGDILVRAVRPGEVVHVGAEVFASGMLGNTVVIQHSDHWSLYAHLQWGSQRVAQGQQIVAGAPLGLMGNTGHSFGAHLHLEIGTGVWHPSRPWSVLRNPYDLVGGAPLPGQPAQPDPTANLSEEELPAIIYRAGDHPPVLAIGSKFWSLSESEADSGLAGGVPRAWLEKITLQNLIADARASMTKGAAPLILRQPGATIYLAHGGAVILRSEEEVRNLKQALAVPEMSVSRARADIIVGDLRRGRDS